MKSLVRWLLFVCVGLPVQGLVYVLYPLIWLYWRIRIYKEPGDKLIAQHEFVDPKGNPVRRVNDDWSLDQSEVSGDVVIAWAFAYTAPSLTNKPVDTLLQMAKNYLKNLGVQSFDEKNKGDVSNRCNNFGVNYCPDSDTAKLGQPAAGPQFYTNSALFALASQHSFLFKIVFWVHWIVMGGWYWAFAPMVYPDDKTWWYVRDMSMKALYVHKYVFGNRWWIKKPMELITYEMSTYRNDLWYAMLGFDPVYAIPGSMDSFFSQKEDATSKLSDRMNGYLGEAIVDLAKQARALNNK